MRTITYAPVNVHDICVDRERYQRVLNYANPALRNPFDPTLIGTPELVLRGDGYHWAVDGQHRIEAAKIANPDTTFEVTCRVHEGLTVEQEAALFDGLNDTKLLTPAVKHKARLTARRTREVFIEQEVVRRGWESTISGVSRYTMNPKSANKVIDGDLYLVKIMGDNRDVLSQTLDILTAAFREQPYGLSPMITEGLGALLLRQKGLSKTINETLMVTILNERGGPQGLTRWIRQHYDLGEATKNEAMRLADYLASTYNARVTGTQRLEWSL